MYQIHLLVMIQSYTMHKHWQKDVIGQNAQNGIFFPSIYCIQNFNNIYN